MTNPPPIPFPSSPPLSIPRSLIIGLSGPSSSGKTTIATHLHSIFSSSSSTTPLCDVTLIHADDFYRPEASLPFRAGHRDWDCAAALDLPALCNCLEAWLQRNEPIGARPRQGVIPTPTGLDAGDGNSTDEAKHDGLLALSDRLRDETQRHAATLRPGSLPRLLLLDGFLLFPSPPLPAVLPSLQHIKILLRAPRAAAHARRLARPGYVTLDGFWADPPGYFEDVVWPHYAESHGRYFAGGDVEEEVDADACARERVLVGPKDEGLERVLEWVVGVVWGEIMGGGEGEKATEER